MSPLAKPLDDPLKPGGPDGQNTERLSFMCFLRPKALSATGREAERDFASLLSQRAESRTHDLQSFRLVTHPQVRAPVPHMKVRVGGCPTRPEAKVMVRAQHLRLRNRVGGVPLGRA